MHKYKYKVWTLCQIFKSNTAHKYNGIIEALSKASFRLSNLFAND